MNLKRNKGLVILFVLIFFPFLIMIPVFGVASMFWPAVVFSKLPTFFVFLTILTWGTFVVSGSRLLLNSRRERKELGSG